MMESMRKRKTHLIMNMAAIAAAVCMITTTACASSAAEPPPKPQNEPINQQQIEPAQIEPAPTRGSNTAKTESQNQGAVPEEQPPKKATESSNTSDTSGSSAPRPALRTTPRDTATAGPQPMVSTALDPISTFSLDTDRASYQRSLELARRGYEIDPAEIRAEEWINALGYGYSTPNRDDEFSISTDVFQHPDTQGMHMARVGIQAPKAQGRRIPVNVTLVLDASGSMKDEDRIGIAQAAARQIVENLDRRDRVAVIHFVSTVIKQESVEHTSPSNKDIRISLNNLRPRGSTNVQAGLNEGLNMAYRERARNPESINYIILFSDGVANVDATNPFAILENLGEKSEYSRPNPIRIITIGVGIQGYNDHLLEQLAQHGNGWYRYLDNRNQARSTFSKENWTRLTQPFADQARAQVTWNPEMVEHWRIVGYENRVTPDSTFTKNLREFAEIPSGTAMTVLYELQLSPKLTERRADTARLAEIEIRWVEPATGISREQYGTLSGAWRESFASLDDHMLRLGVITGLAADIYANLDDGGYGTGGRDAPARLSIVGQELEDLKPHLGGVRAYSDISILLEQLEQQALLHTRPPLRENGYNPNPGSGYSP